MKSTVAIFLLSAAAAMAQPRTEKEALLLLPPIIERSEDLRLVAAFRWDEEAPVRVETVIVGGRLCTYGELKVFSEDGREIPMVYPVIMPLVPTGRITANKGDVVRIGIYTLSILQSLKPGTYFAIVTFSDAFCGDRNVRFTTKKRWFSVRKEDGKKAEQVARANAHSRHAACYGAETGMKESNSQSPEARVASAAVVAHL